MTDNNVKLNTANSHGKKRKIIALALVIIVLIGVSAGILIARDNILFDVALGYAEQKDFDTAEEYAAEISTKKGEYLREYIDLRQDINKHYPELLSEFDKELLTRWHTVSSELYANRDYFGVTVATDIYNIDMRLDGILQTVEFYNKLEPEISNVFEIFNEVNRLYSKGDDGFYVTFTIADEIAKIDEWDTDIAAISEFAKKMYNGESVYLLNYFIKEAEAESSELRASMESFLELGYSETDEVRATGTGVKRFPAVRNSDGEEVDVQDAERYKVFMFDGLCMALIEALGEFYVL